jgi:branched-chain amino acid transport system substrate-binding protein
VGHNQKGGEDAYAVGSQGRKLGIGANEGNEKQGRKVMRVRSLVVSMIVGVAFGLLWGFGNSKEVLAQAKTEMKTVKIGVICPQSGPVAYTGMGVLRGAQVAANQINENGTTGKGPGILVGNQRYKIELVSYDDSMDPAKSVAGMRRLAELNKISVIVGPFGTPSTWACQAVNVQLGVLFDGMTQHDQSRKKGNPLFVTGRVPTMYYGEPMAEACIEKGYKTAAVVTDIVESYTAHGKRFADAFEALGGKVLVSEMVDVKSTTDFHSVMTKIKAKNPDVLFIAVVEEPLALAVTHAFDVGYKGKFIFTSDWGAKAEKILGLQKVEGALVQAQRPVYFTKYPSEDKKGYFTAFRKQYLATYKEEFPMPANSAHDELYMFARAMEIANTTTDPTAIRAACPKALQEGKLPLVFPNNDVLKNGQMVGDADLFLEITGGGYKLIKELKVAREKLE